ncbi:hypothetical protein [Inquilinus sp. Marseille-Q2685]|uniref:hypothetical protein n=1 Tax=Inquilinus sp. Marseille-Q2685 TaxID=2866581 RepID=UPI001CE3B99D|nr:hypothetical protein [Inquilinus sp. Marseille-Q2685]
MPKKTIEDLKNLHSALIEQRAIEAYRLAGPHHETQLEKLSKLQVAIQAIEAVIAEGKDEPDSGYDSTMAWVG